MSARIALPPSLSQRPFSVAEAHAHDVGEGRLRGPDLSRPFHGVRSTASAATFLEHCAEYLPAIGDGFFSHTTAARLWNVPLPRAFARSNLLHVSVPWPARAPRGRGIAGHALRRALVVDRFGLPTTTAARTWLTLASMVPWRELVVAADHLVLDPFVLEPHDIRPYVHLEELRAAVASYSGRGVRRAADALNWVRQGGESRPETLLRILLVESGLPEPSLQVAVEGVRVDMYYERWRTIVSYDGEQHRKDAAQYEKDAEHLERLQNAGLQIVQVRSHALFVEPVRTVARVAHALKRGGWRP